MPKPNHLNTLLSDLGPEIQASIIEYDSRIVPNKHPLLTNFPYKIALVGEAPGKDEVDRQEPFVGMSGRLLSNLLSRCNIVRDACFIGNVCQHRPAENDIDNFSWDGSQIQSGLVALATDLGTFDPNVCLLLGNTPLRAAKQNASVSDWRGSIFISDVPGPFFGRKCIAAYHPAACLRQYDWTPLLLFDIKKCLSQATTKDFTPPYRDLKLFTDVPTLLADLQKILDTKPLIAIDIEGWVDKFVCISIAPSHDYSFIVPFSHRDGRNFYSNGEDEFLVWRLLTTILADSTIPKVLQNSLYDRFVLQYSYGVIIAGVVDDTMLKNHELYCELEKSLGFMCSIYTDEPYYKAEGKSLDRDTFWRYCCRDSATTFEINEKINQWLSGPSRQHYNFNIDLLNPLLYMECRGIRYNTQLAKERLNEVNSHIYRLQNQLDRATGFGPAQTATRASLLETMRQVMCYKRDQSRPKSEYVNDFNRLTNYLQSEQLLDDSFLGDYSIANGLDLNIKGKKFKDYIYKTLECPKQYHPATGELTTNYEALLKISKKSSHPAIALALSIGALRTRSQMLEIHADNDGRIRCGYNAVGTETCRITCYTSPTGSGYNLQTIPAEQSQLAITDPLRKGMRDLFIADPGCYLFQCDLSGADGWTVAAYMASLGDRTMLEDYLVGIKPAKVLCYLLRHGAGALTGKDRGEIKNLTKGVEKDSWDYFACKIGQHGTCYLMGPRKLANQIFIQSEGKVNLSENECRDLQRLFMIRYNVKLWHSWAQAQLSKQSYPPKLTCASGATRKFFGRYQEILGEFLAHAPQHNTTYALNLAALRLWNDPENRLANVVEDSQPTSDQSMETNAPTSISRLAVGARLRIEPLHQIHDALMGQWKISDTQWAIAKVKSYFDNQIVIAGIPITIPFEGSYGTNWALDKESKVGDI